MPFSDNRKTNYIYVIYTKIETPANSKYTSLIKDSLFRILFILFTAQVFVYQSWIDNN